MAVAPDGSPVEVYLRLPGDAEAELIASVVPDGSEILELGSGVGRVAHELVARGHRVTAVDESPEMLAHVRGAETVVARIEELDLPRTFDCVLLASHFVNVPDERERTALLRACARHLAHDGLALIEAYPPDVSWEPGEARRLGGLTLRLAEAEQVGDLVRATMEYEVDGRVWRQPFEAALLDEAGLRRALRDGGLELDRWLDRDRGWLAARRYPQPVG
jgi:SAM-dependent methyltransferase